MEQWEQERLAHLEQSITLIATPAIVGVCVIIQFWNIQWPSNILEGFRDLRAPADLLLTYVCECSTSTSEVASKYFYCEKLKLGASPLCLWGFALLRVILGPCWWKPNISWLHDKGTLGNWAFKSKLNAPAWATFYCESKSSLTFAFV